MAGAGVADVSVEVVTPDEVVPRSPHAAGVLLDVDQRDDLVVAELLATAQEVELDAGTRSRRPTPPSG